MRESETVYRFGLTKEQFADRIAGIVDAAADVLAKTRKPIRPHGVAHVILPRATDGTDANVVLNDLSSYKNVRSMIKGMSLLGKCCRDTGGIIQSCLFVHQCGMIIVNSATGDPPTQDKLKKIAKESPRKSCLFITGILVINTDGEEIDDSEIPKEMSAYFKSSGGMPKEPLSVTAAYNIDTIAGVPMINKKPAVIAFRGGIPNGMGLPKAVMYGFAGRPVDSIPVDDAGTGMYPMGEFDV